MNRVIIGYDINGTDFQKFELMGVVPYYYESSGLTCKMIEITKGNVSKYGDKRIFLLNPEEYTKIYEYIRILNDIIESEEKKNQLLKEMVPSILVEKIMK